MDRHIGSLRALGVLGVALLLATGCSVVNPFAPASAAARQNAEDRALKWAQCMRQHGVNVSDPGADGAIRIQATPAGGSGGGGAVSGGANGANGANGAGGADDKAPPEIQAAMNACKQYEPNGGQAPGPPNQQMVDGATKFAQCMRDHGIPMQDPKVSGGGIQIVASPGAFNPDSDQFKQAQEACQHYLDESRPKGEPGSRQTSNG
jgi:hypothetical protein